MSDTDSDENSKKNLAMSISAEPFVPRETSKTSIPQSDLSVNAPEFVVPLQNTALSPLAQEFVSGSAKSKLSIKAQEFVSTRNQLSAEAPEFVAGAANAGDLAFTEGYAEPYGYGAMGPVGSDVYYYDGNPAIMQGAEQGYMPAYPHAYPQNGYGYYGDPMLHIMSELHSVMESLTMHPADFDKCVQPLLLLISDCSSEQLQVIVDELFNQMVKEANFRYSGARICKYFYENLQYSADIFLQLLIAHCYRHFEGFAALTDEPGRHCSGLCSFSLILGEFIVNMKDVDIVMTNLPKLLKDSLFQVLQHQTDEALGAVSQILKLTGGVLTEKNFDIQDILLEAKQAVQNVSTPQALLLIGVLRRYSKSPSKQVAQASNTGLLTTSSRAQNYGIDLEPIYYDHMGQEFTAEEKAFMDSCGGNTNSDDVATGGEAAYNGDNGLAQDDDDEMDPEIEAAFDQFLREIDESIVSPSISSNSSVSFHTGVGQSPAQPPSASNGSYPGMAARNLSFTYVENQVMNRPDLHSSASLGDFSHPRHLLGGYASGTTSRPGITAVPLPTAVNAVSLPMAAAAWNMAAQNGMSDVSAQMGALHIDANQQQRLQQQLQQQQQMQQQYLHQLHLQQIQQQMLMGNGNAAIGGSNLSAVANQVSLHDPMLYSSGLTQHFQ